MKRIILGFLCLAFAFSVQATDWKKDFPIEYDSWHFIFRYKETSPRAAELAQFSDAFVQILGRDFVKTPFDRAHPVEILVLPNEFAFQRFMTGQFGIRKKSVGSLYSPGFEFFVTFEDIDLGTYTHAMVRSIIDRNLQDCPVWAVEGIPLFFQNFFGYWNGNQLVVDWGYLNAGRLRLIGGKLIKLKLKNILIDQRRTTPLENSERGLLAAFLWQQGRLPKFMKLVAARDHTGFDSYFEAAMGKPVKEITPLWEAYLADINVHYLLALQVPQSTIFSNKFFYEGAIARYHPWHPLQVLPEP